MSARFESNRDELLLEHLDWVRALALTLLRDPAAADDVRQDVWLLTRRVGLPAVGLRSWLSGVVHNLARERHRAKSRRELHEARAALAAARSEEEPEAARQVAIQQVVVQRLMALPRTYRDALLARYYEQLTPTQIAERDGIPVATVKTRLRRGLVLLRQSMERKESDGAPAIVVLAAAFGRTDELALTSGGAGLGAGLAVASVAALAATAYLVVGAGTERKAAPSGADAQPIEVAAPTAGGPLAEGGTRALVAEAASEGAVPVADRAVAAGIVVDISGRAVAGVEVRFRAAGSDAALPFGASTGAAGEFELLLPPADRSGGTIVVREDDAWIQVGTPLVAPGADNGALTVVVAQRLRLEGAVTNAEDGRPVPRAAVFAGVARPFQFTLGRPLDRVVLASFRAETDAFGRFVLDVPFDVAGLDLRVERVGYGVLRTSFDGSTDPLGLALALAPLTSPGAAFGRVVDAEGRAEPRAWVSDGREVVRVDDFGEFQLGTADGTSPLSPLVAVAPGRLPTRIERADGGAPYTIRLERASLVLAGVVRGERALEGLVVRPIEFTPFGDYAFIYSGRSATAALVVEQLADPIGASPIGRSVGAIVDAEGRFELGGLVERVYGVEVFDPVSLARGPLREVQAGSLALELFAPEVQPALAGLVLDAAGAPVEGSRVQAAYSAREGAPLILGPTVTADATGSFRFGTLSRERVTLLVDAGPRWLQSEGPRALEPGDDRVTITVEAGTRVSLVIDPERLGGFAGDGVELSFRDARGGDLFHVVDDLVAERRLRTPLRTPGEDGVHRPLPLLVPARATEVVLSRGDEALVRAPLELVPGGDVTVEL